MRLKREIPVTLLSMLVVLLAGGPAAGIEARKDTRLYLRLDAGGSVHPSDKTFETFLYSSGPDYQLYTDQETKMLYHFDQKFGFVVSGAAGYRLTKAIECELGVAYTSYDIGSVDQEAHHSIMLLSDRYRWVNEYAEAGETSFRSVDVRPAIRIKPSRRGPVVPWIGAGIDVCVISGSGELAFELPGTSIEGALPEVARLAYDGTETLVGVDIASGLELRFWPSFSLNFGASYLFLGRAFKSFHEIVVDGELSRELEDIGYLFDGMSFAGVRAFAGVVWYP